MGPGDLSRALAPLPRDVDPRIVVGRETYDDAGVFVLAEDVALVQTVDFFAAIVDDPYTFGQVAAANALSDVYAMGGEPVTALNIVGFPAGKLPLAALSEILRGGHDKVHEAGAVLIGGHTIIDDEVKYGLAVTGRADPRRLLINSAARPGDALVLTKPIGSGILSTAAKGSELDGTSYQALVETMCALNAQASRAALDVGVRCATDVTGFGLLGHASHIARGSGVTLRIDVARVPILTGAREAWRRGARTGGGERNAEYLESRVEWGSADELARALLCDPQTSGGLLVAVPSAATRDYLSRVPRAVEIGSVVERGQFDIVLS